MSHLMSAAPHVQGLMPSNHVSITVCFPSFVRYAAPCVMYPHMFAALHVMSAAPAQVFQVLVARLT